MSTLPEAFGIRICELQVYVRYDLSSEPVHNYRRITQPLHSAEPAIYSPGPDPATIDIKGLEPNHTYEVFCYAEDIFGNTAVSNVEIVTTEDTTAPTVHMLGLQAKEHE